jgi:pimeloyl-ACP methyl ester carboxylesterase
MIWVFRIAAALVTLAATAYLITPLFRPVLDDSVRNGVAAQRDPGMPEIVKSVFAELQGGVTHIRFADPGEGNAGTIVLLHGFSNPSYVYRDYFKSLSDAGYLVVAPDFFGRGYSDRPAGPYDEALYLAQVDEVVDRYSMGRAVHLVGYSMGGSIAARYAAKYPNKVETVGLIAPAGLACGSSMASPMTWPVLGDWVFRVFGPWILESYSGADWVEAKDPHYWRARYREMARYRDYEEALLSTARNFNMLDSCAAMKSLKASGKRVLAVFAEQDKTIPIAHADVLAAFPGSARIVRAPDRGHSITYAAPDLVMPEILKLVSMEP